ncbi:MAG: hypothetical protein NTX22_10265 [Ignavibacteriales bacterium]|nr:hypothetical protein [Ignavibacteriales bacterium]
MKTRLILFAVFLMLISNSNSFSQNYAVALKVSSIGVTAEGIRSFGENINARVGVSIFPLKINGGGGTTEDYKYTANVNLFVISALADWFPFNNFLRVTGGIMINLNKIKATATPTKTYVVGADYYTPEKLGNLEVNIKMNKVAPYLGIGIGNPTALASGFGFSFEIGAFYQGSPTVDLAASGLLEPSAAPDQEKLVEDNLSWFKLYPVVSLGITYKF